MARLGLLALGLGVGGALASMPGTASADSSTWLSEVSDFLSSAFPAASSGGGDLAISMNGVTLFQSGTAEAYSGNGDIAIANGAGSEAYAFGSHSYADALGLNSTAVAGGLNAESAIGSSNDTAFVNGDGSYGFAGGIDADHSGSYDYALIFGNNDTALSGGDLAGAGNYDGTYVEGDNLAHALAQGSDHLLDLVKFYGDGGTSTAAAATDLLGGDPTGAFADGTAFWTDLFSGDSAAALVAGQDFWADLAASFDAGSLAGDASNFWTELATLF